MALAKSYIKCKDHNDENGVLEADHGLVTRQTCLRGSVLLDGVVEGEYCG